MVLPNMSLLTPYGLSNKLLKSTWQPQALQTNTSANGFLGDSEVCVLATRNASEMNIRVVNLNTTEMPLRFSWAESSGSSGGDGPCTSFGTDGGTARVQILAAETLDAVNTPALPTHVSIVEGAPIDVVRSTVEYTAPKFSISVITIAAQCSSATPAALWVSHGITVSSSVGSTRLAHKREEEEEEQEEEEPTESTGSADFVLPDTHWNDTDGKRIEAHAAGMLQSPADQRWYWFGESKKLDDSHKDPHKYETQGVNCYSAATIAGPWTNKGQVLTQNDIVVPGAHGPWIVQRPKVIFNNHTNISRK